MFFLASIKARTFFSGSLILFALFLPAAQTQAAFSEAASFFIDRGTDAEIFDRFGNSLARGDFNGDGFEDLAIGMNDFDLDGFGNAGAVVIAFGNPSGVPGPLTELTALDALPGSDCAMPAVLARFGQALAVADFNVDGYDDLAIGAPNNPATDGVDILTEVGAVSVFWGQADSTFQPAKCLVNGRDGLPGVFERFSHFGSALAAGDFESDGVPDLAIGAPRARVNFAGFEGAVTVVYGSVAEPLDPAVSQYWHQNLPGLEGSAENDDRFGAALATGDLVLGQDTACDLVIGVPDDNLEGAGLDRGSVHVLFGCTASGLSSEDSVRWTADDCLLNGEQDGAQFGSALAVGNFDNQGAEDLAIGAPGDVAAFIDDAGAVCTLYGNQMSPATVLGEYLSKLNVAPTTKGDRFGAALATVGFEDRGAGLLVGSPTFGGALNVPSFFYYEADPGLPFDIDRASHHVLIAGDSASRLGEALAAVRFDGATWAAAVSAPRLDHLGLDESGAVWILPIAEIFADSFESGDLSAWSEAVGD